MRGVQGRTCRLCQEPGSHLHKPWSWEIARGTIPKLHGGGNMPCAWAPQQCLVVPFGTTLHR